MAQLSVNRSLLQRGNGKFEFRSPKTKRARRVIALSPSNVAVLREHKESQKQLRQSLGMEFSENDLVFCNPDGSPYRPDTISHAWLKLARRTGIDVRLHDARHTCASLMLRQGTHPRIVQERLGHASISTTLDTYSHTVPSLQQSAASRLDDVFLGGEKNQSAAIR